MRKTLTTILATFALSAAAQSESGLWLGADVSYDITHRLGAEFELGTRFEDNFSSFTRYDAALGFDYKLLPWLKLGAGYDFIRDYSPGEAPSLVYKKDANSPDGLRHDSDGNLVVNGYNAEASYWRTKHRAYFDATGKWKAGRFTFSLRERYQFTNYAEVEDVELRYRDELEPSDLKDYTGSYVGPYIDSEGDSYYYGLTRTEGKSTKAKHYLRSRLAVDYNIRHCPLTPFASYELANDLSDGFSVVRHRATVGFDWNLTRNKQHALSLAYAFQHGAHEEAGNSDMHIFSIGYKLSLQSPRAKAAKKAKKKARKAAASSRE